GAERLGSRLRASRRQVAALDRQPELAADLRPLRPERDVRLGRSAGEGRTVLPYRSRLRRLGRDRVARTVGRGTRGAMSRAALRAAVTGLSLSLLVAACGAAKEPTSTAAPVRTGGLRAWAVVDDAPGISQLAPDFGGLDVVDRVDHEALVRNGDAIR